MADTPEGRIKKEIVAYLKEVGAYYAPYVQNGYGKSGVPDYLACWRGFFVAIEVKVPGRKPTPWQEREIAEIQKAHGVAFVATCVADVATVFASLARVVNH